ncbi:MAG: lysylphosphatidylglycerol synthase transmembrane domain-containing protein [Pseudomonadota bacterium]
MTDTSNSSSDPVASAQSPDKPIATQWHSIPRRTLTIALSILPLVALINVGVLIWSLGAIDLSERLVAPHLLGLVALLVFVPMISNSIRLTLWGRFLGLKLGFFSALKVVTGTMVANSMTPSATGSVPIKLLFLMGEGVESRRALTLISFQTAEDALVLFSLVGVCLGFTGLAMFDFLGSDPDLLARLDITLRTISMAAIWVLVGLAGLALIVAGGLLGRRVRLWAADLSRRVGDYIATIAGDWAAVARRGKWIAAVNVMLALGQWMARFSIAGLVLAAFGTDWSAALFWLLQYLVQSISSVVPTPGGVGGAEAGFLLLFAPFVEIDVLVPAMSTWRLMFFYLPLIGAALLFFCLQRWLRQASGDKQITQRSDPRPPTIGDPDEVPQPAE